MTTGLLSMPFADPFVLAYSNPQLRNSRPTYYVDGVSAGDGSRASPFSDFSTIKTYALTANALDNYVIALKSGATIYDQLSVNNQENLLVDIYGGSTKPILDLTVSVATTGWTDEGSNHWSNSTWAFGDVAMYCLGQPCERRDSAAQMTSAYTYQCMESTGNWPYLYFYDSGATTMHLYLGDGTSFPTSSGVMRRARRDSGADTTPSGTGSTVVGMGNCPGLVLNAFKAVGGWATNIQITGASHGLLLDEVESYGVGGNGANYSQDLIDIVGTSKASKMQDVTLRRVKSYRSMTGLGHGVELSWIDGMAIDDFEVSNVRYHAIEFWNSCSNVIVQRMKVRSTFSTCVARSQEAATSLHENITFRNCDVVQRRMHGRVGTGGGGSVDGGSGFEIGFSGADEAYQNLKNWTLVNNSFDIDDNSFFYCPKSASPTGEGDGTVNFSSNLLRTSHLTQAQSYAVYIPNMTSTSTMRDNAYHFASKATYSWYGADAYTSLASWQSGSGEDTGSLDIASGTTVLVNSGASLRTTRLELASTAAGNAVGLANNYAATEDFVLTTRGADPDAGAYEFVAYPAFGFTSSTGAAANTLVSSETMALSGAYAREVSASGGNSQYRVYDGTTWGAWTASAGIILPGQSIEVRALSSAAPSTAVVASLVLGGTTGTFSVTTSAFSTLYSHQMPDTTYDGRQTVGTSYSSSLSIQVQDTGSGPRGATSKIGGLSFISVNIAPDTSVTSAYLILNRSSGGGGLPITVFGQSNESVSTTTAWASGYQVDAHFGEAASATATFNTVATGTSNMAVNITALVNEILASTNWASGNFLNLWLEGTATSYTFSTSNARLVIT